MKTTDLKNWVVYYCFHIDNLGPGTVPLRVHAVELPNTEVLNWVGAVAEWEKQYFPVQNQLTRLAAERVPDDWYSSGGKAANTYYMERVAAITGWRFPMNHATPEVGFEACRAEHTGQKEYDPDAVMRAVRAAGRGNPLS